MNTISNFYSKESQSLLKALLSLDKVESEKLLKQYHFDFDKMKSKRGFGFLFTFLRRFNEEDFISEDVSNDDINDMVKLLISNGLVLDKETMTAHSNPKYDFGCALSCNMIISNNIKNLELANILIENGADVNYEDHYGNIPLFFANHYNLAIKYVENTNNPHHVNKNNENALFYQVRNLRTTKFLIEYGLNPFLINKSGDSLIMHCIRYGSPDVLDYLLKTFNNKEAKSFQQLKNKNIKHREDCFDVNYRNPITQEDILFTLKHKKMLDVLMKYGLNIHLLNENNQTVLFTTNNKISFVKTLIKYHLDINHQDNDGDTILHKPNTENLIEILANAGFNFNLKNKLGDTVIDYYKKRNAEDLYSGFQSTIDLIEEKIKEQEKFKMLQEKNLTK